MTYTKAESLSFGYLFGYLERAHRRNLQGGGRRAITTTATASYLPQGEDGGEPTIVVEYNGTRVLELTPTVLDFVGVAEQHSKPAVNLYNRFLAEHAPGHYMVHDPRDVTLMYGTEPGKVLQVGFTTGTYFSDYSRFISINGNEIHRDYRLNKEDN